MKLQARRLAPDKFKTAREEFKLLTQQGICKPSSSELASPLHMVPKKNGTWRMCGDYRRLNSQTIPDNIPFSTSMTLLTRWRAKQFL